MLIFLAAFQRMRQKQPDPTKGASMQRLLVHTKTIAELRYDDRRRRLTIIYRTGETRPIRNVDPKTVMRLVAQLPAERSTYLLHAPF
jgi:hypothetical protein